MTATIKAPKHRGKSRPIRFTSMESLGFSNPESIWTDSPTAPASIPHAPVNGHDTLADWAPTEVTDRLGGRNTRWGLVIFTIVVLGAMVGTAAWWLYQRPVNEAAAANAAVRASANALQSSLPALEGFNAELAIAGEDADTSGLFAADAAARQLFSDSGDLPTAESAARSAAAAASAATLDGVRLVSDAHAYHTAVRPILITRSLETDPALIELDEAARSFGDWQLRFDQVRTALPDGVIPEVTAQLDVLSGDLSTMLTDYVDALRNDDRAGAADVIAGLSARIEVLNEELEAALVTTKEQVTERISEAKAALADLLETS